MYIQTSTNIYSMISMYMSPGWYSGLFASKLQQSIHHVILQRHSHASLSTKGALFHYVFIVNRSDLPDFDITVADSDITAQITGELAIFGRKPA